MAGETLAGTAIGSSIGIGLTVIGANVELLMIGLIAATLMSLWLGEIDTRRKAACGVLLSGILAGYGANLVPVVVAWLAPATVAVVVSVPANAAALQYFSALVLGILGPTLIPRLVKRANEKAEAA